MPCASATEWGGWPARPKAVMTLETTRRLVAAVTVALAGCSTSRTPPPARPGAAAAGTFTPRLVRQIEMNPRFGSATQVTGATRSVHVDQRRARVFDPATGTVYADARIDDAFVGSVDPSLRILCVAQRESSRDATTSIGAYDLETNRWLWRELLYKPPTPFMSGALATPELCAFSVDLHGGTVEMRRLRDGARVASAPVPFFRGGGPTTARWTDDRSLVLLTRPAQMSRDVLSIEVDVRDGRTLAQRATLFARCVDVGATARVALDEEVESPARREWLATQVPELLGACPGRPATASEHRTFSRPSPWAPLSNSVVAYHGEEGLFLWDFGHERAPVRIAGAPALARFMDVDGESRAEEMTVPPDASWVGVIRDEAALVRYAVADGRPLPEVPLPGPLPVTARDAYWQVMAGARDRLLAIRHIGSARIVYVGDTSGSWRRSAAHAFLLTWQTARHFDAERRWLLGDDYYGLQLLDEQSGQVLAAHDLLPHSWRRSEGWALSPDGREIFLATSASSSDDVGALAFLDARTLRLLRRFPPSDDLRVEDWRPEGIVVSKSFGENSDVVWSVIDPLTGARRRLALGDVRSCWESARRGDLHVDRAFPTGAFVSGPRGTRETWLSIVDGGAAIAHPDGHAFCAGRGCALLRCVAGPRDARPATDPACAGLLRTAPAAQAGR
jgi:hypothetical protein